MTTKRVRATLPWLALAAMALSVPALAADPVSLTVSRSGLDAQAHSAAERFEITYDGLARWQTSAFGMSAPGCPNQGGSFEGRVTPEQAQTLATAAREALASQKGADQNAPNGPRSVTTSIWVDLDGRIDTGDVLTATKQYQALMKAIDELETSLLPKGLVVMRAFAVKGGAKVVFHLTGDSPVTILLPDKPGEAFTIGSARLRYAKPLGHDSTFELTPAHKTAELVLRADGPAPGVGQPVRYANAIILHHRKGDPLTGVAPAPPELSLCAALESAR